MYQEKGPGPFIAVIAVFVVCITVAALSQTAANDQGNEATFVPHKTYGGRISAKSAELYNQGTKLLNAGEYGPAIEKLLLAVKESRENVNAWDHLGICYRRIGQYAKAIEAYQTSIEINPENPVPYGNLGLIHSLHTGDFPKAVYYYKKVIELDPTEPEGPYGLGVTHEIMKAHDAAIEWFLRAAELYSKRSSPLVSHAYYRLGLNYQKKDPPDYKAAIKYFVRARTAGFQLPQEVEEFLRQAPR